MPIPKNALTTHPAARSARRVYRHAVRPTWQDTVARFRSAVRGGRRSHAPGFVIVGTNKSGTTSLFEWITAQPGVGVPLLKELHFFDKVPQKGADWYRAQFWGPDDLLWGEATPEYYETPGAPAALARIAPNAKIIALFRDPVDRAISHFHNAVDHAAEHRPIDRAIAEEVAALRRGELPGTEAERRCAYVARSQYARSAAGWLAAFPRENCLFLVAERSAENRVRVLEFLGLPPGTAPVAARSNARDYRAPSPAVVEEIRASVRADTESLPALVGWDRVPPEWTTYAGGPGPGDD